MMRNARVGGNRKPQVFPNCAHCGERFGPRRCRSHRYCSRSCAYADRKRVKSRAKPTPAARRAQRRVAYLIAIGALVRAERCEECQKPCKTEAAHFDYSEPERVRWLCTSCHRRWDKAACSASRARS